MGGNALAASIMLSFAICITPPVTSAQQVKVATDEEASHCRWLAARLTEANSIKVGMTRTDLLKVFEPDGGMQQFLPVRYVLRSCSLIKVSVTFELPKGISEKDLIHSTAFGDLTSGKDVPINSEIKIAAISTPYLELRVED